MPDVVDHGVVGNKEEGWHLMESNGNYWLEKEFTPEQVSGFVVDKNVVDTPKGKAQLIEEEGIGVIPLTPGEASKLIKQHEDLSDEDQPRDTHSEGIFDSVETQGVGPPPSPPENVQRGGEEQQQQASDSTTSNRT